MPNEGHPFEVSRLSRVDCVSRAAGGGLDGMLGGWGRGGAQVGEPEQGAERNEKDAHRTDLSPMQLGHAAQHDLT